MWHLGKSVMAAAGMAALALAAPSPAAAHCDSLDGPVVKAAREALSTGDVAPVLAWVSARDEPEIREAFARTLTVRGAGGAAADLADRWFFETLVRVHRAGEGEPYTGLKPAGYQPPAGIAAADRELESGSGGALAGQLGAEVAAALEARYERVRALAGYAPADVVAGRAYVRAYVEYIHFVETLHGLLEEGAGAHSADGPAHDPVGR